MADDDKTSETGTADSPSDKAPKRGATQGGAAPGDPELNAGEDAVEADAAAGGDTSEVLKAQIADLTDRLLRAHAEMDNQRKLAEKDRADTSKYAIANFAKDIVLVGDNFQRAIAAVPEGAADSDPALKSFLEGVSMADREFHNILERHGIHRIEPTGEAFDPHFHQAMMEQEDASVAQGTVLQVIQAGYVLNERILRPAMVVVAKGGAKAGADAKLTRPASDVAPHPPADNENTSSPNGPANGAAPDSQNG